VRSRLLVILGAGASHDCVSDYVERHDEFRPPLVEELFEARESYSRILHRYPLAEQAAADIRPALRGDAVGIETFLRETLRDSEHEHYRRQYWAIPLYLQDLFFEIGMWDHTRRRGFTAQPDSYDRLVNAAMQVDEVTFVTLNYDDLLDRRVFIHGPLESVDSYLGRGRKWALIKLHGSVNWGRRVRNAPATVAPTDPYLAQTFSNLGDEIDFDAGIVLRPHTDIRDVRLDETPFDLYFPALSAPLGPEDEVVCPNDHVEYLREVTGHWDPLDVLVIGYSGLDKNVLTHLSWGGRQIRSLTVVSESEIAASAAAERISAEVNVAPDSVVLLGAGFTGFAYNLLGEYMSRIGTGA
jgi:hypothetical protein